MGAPVKFLFDLDFSPPGKGRDQAPSAKDERLPSAEDIAEQLAAAESRGYRNGFEAAQREIIVANERQTAQALADVGQAINMIAARLGGVETRIETEALDVAVAVARKLTGALLASEPLSGITAVVSDCFRHLVATPHLVVRLNDGIYDAGRVEIDKLAKQSGFQGRLVILAEPDIATGDCKIEWADGGVVLERAAIEAKIDDFIGRYMASRNAA